MKFQINRLYNNNQLKIIIILILLEIMKIFKNVFNQRIFSNNKIIYKTMKLIHLLKEKKFINLTNKLIEKKIKLL